MSRLGTAARRALGLLLLLAAYLPAHRLLDPAQGAAAAATRDVGEALWSLALWGTVLAGALALALARLAAGIALRDRLSAAAARLASAPPVALAGAAALVAFLASLAAARLVFDGLPTLVDAMVQLLNARAWAAGRLAAPLLDPAAARLVQNGLALPDGWVSVYPPGHTALLAVGLRVGAPWLVGPVLTAITAGATVLLARRLLVGSSAPAATLGGALVALSPFLALLGGSYLSHSSAAAAGALALYCALRARDGRAAWAVGAGAAMGAMVLIRPWTGLVLGVTLSVGVWWSAGRERTRWLTRRLTLWALGGAPAALALAAYNRRFFGAALRLGYEVAFGPAHGLGLHRDPWGAPYGVREAIAYSGFDLMTLGVHLLETPVSAVGVVGLWLLLASRLPAGAGVLLAWALAPVLANGLYWHHGYHFGPRMLYEAAPAWCILVALAIVEGSRRDDWAGRAVLWVAVVALTAGAALQLPGRIASARWSEDAKMRATAPVLPAPGTGLVFVHASWPSRVAARLAGSGMRRDSIETALRRNDLCLIQRALGSAPPRLAALDLEPLPGSPPRLRALEVAPGTYARVDPATPLTPECAREARADRMGTLELEPLLWRTPIPGLESGGPLLFRDLGPDANARVLARHPGMQAWLLLPADGGGLVPYQDGMKALWGEERKER